MSLQVLLLVSLLCLATSLCSATTQATRQLSFDNNNNNSIEAVQALINRRIPASHANSFQLVLLASDASTPLDHFKVEANAGNVTLCGTTGTILFTLWPLGLRTKPRPILSTATALASALNWYLREVCLCQFTWLDEQLSLPSVLPDVSPAHTATTPYTYRYYFNVCTVRSFTLLHWNF